MRKVVAIQTAGEQGLIFIKVLLKSESSLTSLYKGNVIDPLIVVSAFDHLVIVPVAVWYTSSVDDNNSVGGGWVHMPFMSVCMECFYISKVFVSSATITCFSSHSGFSHPSGLIRKIVKQTDMFSLNSFTSLLHDISFVLAYVTVNLMILHGCMVT